MNNPKSNFDKWKECDISQLVSHFHRFNTPQFERLDALHLDAIDLKELFGTGEDLVSFDIKMGIENAELVKGMYSFTPTIEVKYSEKEFLTEKKFKHGFGVIPAIANEVPFPFKDWLTKNWLELDASLIDDAFMAFLPDKGSISDNQPRLPNPFRRLLSYHFTDKINEGFFEFVKTNRNIINHLVLHLGIDKNKVDHKDHFNFSPVFEVHITKQKSDANIASINRLGLRVFEMKSKNADDLVYYEYVLPCPSTCPKL